MKTIWMVCQPISESPGIQDGAYLAVGFTPTYAAWLGAQIAHCRELYQADSKFFRLFYFDGTPDWLTLLVPDTDEISEASKIADNLAGGITGGWYEMPAGWSPDEAQRCRVELQVVGISHEGVLYQWNERHDNFEFESPELQASIVEAMLSRLG